MSSAIGVDHNSQIGQTPIGPIKKSCYGSLWCFHSFDRISVPSNSNKPNLNFHSVLSIFIRTSGASHWSYRKLLQYKLEVDFFIV